MYNINLATIYKFCSTDPFREWMNKPFSIGDDVYATDGKIMLKINNCVKDFPDVSELTDTPNRVTYIFKDEPNSFIKISVDKLESLLNFIEPVDEIVYEERNVTCEDCNGSGEVDFVYDSVDGESFYMTETCPVCNGIGSITKDVEYKTGNKIIPYKSSYIDIYNGYNLSNTVNAEMLLNIVNLCKEIGVSEFNLGVINYTKMKVNLNDYIEIIICGCMKTDDENLKYKD